MDGTDPALGANHTQRSPPQTHTMGSGRLGSNGQGESPAWGELLGQVIREARGHCGPQVPATGLGTMAEARRGPVRLAEQQAPQKGLEAATGGRKALHRR